jgi:hypothetical protein
MHKFLLLLGTAQQIQISSTPQSADGGAGPTATNRLPKRHGPIILSP